MSDVIVVIGAGFIGQAIVRRVSAGKHVLLADLRPENAAAAAKTLTDAGFHVTTATVDVSSRTSVHALVEAATARGDVAGVIHAAGVSPSQAPPECHGHLNNPRYGRLKNPQFGPSPSMLIREGQDAATGGFYGDTEAAS